MGVIAIEDEAFKSYMLVCAAEDWAVTYSEDPDSHTKLMRLEAIIEQHVRKYFRDQAQNVNKYVNWNAYQVAQQTKRAKEIQAADDYSVNVIVEDTVLDTDDGTFINILFDDIAAGAAIGAAFGEAVYNRYAGLESTSDTIQRFARERAAQLVGKKLDKDGNIVDNPKSTYNINEVTRNRIRESIRTSIALGEDQESATSRLRKVIYSPKRAALIAQTESVNSYQGGLREFGVQAGAVGKESQSVGAVDQCATYDKMGIVDINYLYGGQFLGPSYHPRCRCGQRLVFPEELESNK